MQHTFAPLSCAVFLLAGCYLPPISFEDAGTPGVDRDPSMGTDRDAAIASDGGATSDVDSGTTSDVDSGVTPDVDGGNELDGSMSAVDAQAPEDPDADTQQIGGTGVLLDKPFSALNDAEAQALCKWQGAQNIETTLTRSQLCRLTSVPVAKDPAECRSMVRRCELLGAGGTPHVDDCTKVKADGLPAECGPVTVRQYEACISTTRKKRLDAANTLTCDAAGSADGSYNELPPECDVVKELCPVVLP